MKSHATAHEASLKVGRVLGVLALLMAATLFIGWALRGCQRNDAAEMWQQSSQSNAGLANFYIAQLQDSRSRGERLAKDNTDLKVELEGNKNRMGYLELALGLPIRSNSPIIERLDAIESGVKSVGPFAFQFSCVVNGVKVEDGIVIDSLSNRTFKVEVFNMGQATAENVTVDVSPFAYETNVLYSRSRQWTVRGHYVHQEGTNTLGVMPFWETKYETSLAPGSGFITDVVQVSTNYPYPILTMTLGVRATGSRHIRYRLNVRLRSASLRSRG